jgi:acid stress-induced BolA-like protein IbaG/YrbA
MIVIDLWDSESEDIIIVSKEESNKEVKKQQDIKKSLPLIVEEPQLQILEIKMIR